MVFFSISDMTFFFIPSTLRLSRYKNVFCYLCQNSVDIQQVQHVCQAEIVDSKRTLTGAFALLLDTTISERVSESKPLDMCPFMTVWDHVKVNMTGAPSRTILSVTITL